MLFNSYAFLIFFPTVTTLYFLLPHRARWALLLVASCIFYMAFIPVYILVLGATIIIDYSLGLLIAGSVDPRRKKFFLVLAILSTCAVLFIFKYFNFFMSNAAAIASYFHLAYPVGVWQLILPIGLSFHTFQSLSYVIEVYRGHQKPERHFGIYALYVMFYPQLVAGPIERPQNLLHQFREEHSFEHQRVADGLKLMAWGFFKKVVIADRLAPFVAAVYDHPADHQGISFILATAFFAFQIYCDFSGYSDIAIGAARVMGFRLMTNFRFPYLASTIAGFWKQWHISLSTWFRDYVYIPLGGSRVAKPRWYFNLMVTFLISGLWHGANWTYVVWGALHGFYMVVGAVTAGFRDRLARLAGWDQHSKLRGVMGTALVFVLVCFSWIFFRAQNVQDALYIVTHLWSGVPEFFVRVVESRHAMNRGVSVLKELTLGQGPIEFPIAWGTIAVLVGVEMVQANGGILGRLSRQPVWIRWTCYTGLVSAILLLGCFDAPKQFIYFQF